LPSGCPQSTSAPLTLMLVISPVSGDTDSSVAMLAARLIFTRVDLRIISPWMAVGKLVWKYRKGAWQMRSTLTVKA